MVEQSPIIELDVDVKHEIIACNETDQPEAIHGK